MSTNAPDALCVNSMDALHALCASGASDGKQQSVTREFCSKQTATASKTVSPCCLARVARNLSEESATARQEIPAGTLDRVESLPAAAARELREETGYQAAALESLGELWMSPGILHEKMHLFVAKGLKSGSQSLEPNERIEPRVVRWSEAIAMCHDGLIEDAKTIAAIFLADRWLRS